jgi:hypothetical protein
MDLPASICVPFDRQLLPLTSQIQLFQ